MRAFRIPERLWDEIEARIPPGERTAVVVACLTAAVRRRKREGANGND